MPPSWPAALRAVMVTALGAALLAPAGALVAPAAASSAPAPQVQVTAGGAPAAAVAVGDTVVASTSSAADDTGAVDQVLTTQWDTAQAVTDGAVTAPEGWGVEYRVDGSWTTTAPSGADLAGTDAVRASGTTGSAGVLGGDQLAVAHGSGELKAGGGSFQGSSGGDGWDVFFAGTKVLNVWHHDGAYNLDCHYRTDGSSCNASVYSVPGYTTPAASTGAVVAGKVYSLVGHGGDAGILCTDVSATPFTGCGYTSLATGNFSSYWSTLGRQVLAGTRVYAPVVDAGGGALACFDTATSAACPGQPYRTPGLSPVGPASAFASTVAGRVFVTANKVWCFTAATGAPCTGSWPVGSLSNASSVTPLRDASLAAVGVCTLRPAGSCWDFSGAAVTPPAGLVSLLAAHPANAVMPWSDWSWTARRVYWAGSDGAARCYDWTTDAACAGFAPPTLDTVRYSTVIDPSDPTCVWSNGDNGQIRTFDGLTGSIGCPPPTDPTLQVSYTTAAPRLACSADDRVASWNSITLHTAGAIGIADLRVTVKDSVGDVVPGWQDVVPPADGVVDLTALTVASTGSQPSFEVKAIGATDADTQALTVDVAYTSHPAQLCVDLTVAHDCPVLTPGVQAGAAVPVADLTVTGTASADAGDGAATTTVPTTVTRADQTGCIGSVAGTVAVAPPGGPVPAAGTTVTLNPAGGGAAYATATADADGDYAFPHVRPGSYRVTALGTDTAVTVTDTAQDADVSVPVTAPFAGPVTVTTLQGVAGTAPVDVTVDDLTTADLTTVVLQDPSDLSWSDHVTVDGQGTWRVTAQGSLAFTPLTAFSGTGTGVTYRVADGFGSTATATAHAVVTPVRPTARPVRSTGVQGSTQTATPDASHSTLAMDPASVRVFDPATGTAETSVTVDGVGTFTADTVHGTVVLVPVGDFVGSYTAIWSQSDETGQDAVSTLTVTTTALDPRAPKVTVDPGVVARVPVTGVPVGATVAGPAAVDGATAVTYARTRITVTPSAGFAGAVQVPFTVTNGTATVSRAALVSVRPAGVRSVRYAVRYGTTVVTWPRSSSTGVAGYQVRVGGKVVCTTTATTCTLDRVLGPKARVTVVTVGTDGSRTSAGTVGSYTATAGCGGVSAVYFASGSARLDGATTAALRAAAATVRAQGFTTVCLVGFTDADGSASYNLALSKRRVNAVGDYLAPRLGRGVRTVKDYSGESDPAAPNDTADGRSLNRRVEIRVG